MSRVGAIKYEQENSDVLQALMAVGAVINRQGFNRNLLHLVQLRASQINKCAFYIKMHAKEARQDGETSERLDRVIVWRHVDDFSEAERAALAWTEALTVLDEETDYAALRARLRDHYSDKEIGALTSMVAMINLWNRLQVSRH